MAREIYFARASAQMISIRSDCACQLRLRSLPDKAMSKSTCPVALIPHSLPAAYPHYALGKAYILHSRAGVLRRVLQCRNLRVH
jgi:hypothetical protein